MSDKPGETSRACLATRTTAHNCNMHRLARYRSGRVELWITPCVVTMPPPKSTALIVPTNERLCGTQFAHFPKGGPTPAAKGIGERDYERPRAERLLYQCESVDGIVTYISLEE